MTRVIGQAARRWCACDAQWGRDDCALAVADVIAPVLGYDPAARWREQYKTRAEYLARLRQEGLRSLAQAVSRVASDYGWNEISPADAQPGDVGILKHSNGEAVCLASGDGFWVARQEQGVAVRRNDDVVKAWSVLNDV